MKVCRSCGAKKSLDDFYAHSKMADGHLNKCKDCVKACVRKYREVNLEAIQAHDRQRGKLPHKVAAHKAYAKANPEILARGQKAWVKRNPEKKHAHSVAARISRPEVCERCGNPGKIHRHHPDYTKPNEVMFVCQACHTAIHVEARNH